MRSLLEALPERHRCSAGALALLLALAAGCTGAPESAAVPETCTGYDLEGNAQELSPCRVFRGRLRLPHQKQLPVWDRPLQVVAVGFERLSAAPAGSDAGPGGDAGAAPVGVTGEVRPRLFYGPRFDAIEGAGYRPSIPFFVVVPCQVSVNLLLQIPRSSGALAPGILVAPMSFAGSSGGPTTLIPGQAADTCGGQASSYDLGLVDLVLEERNNFTSGTITLGAGNSNSPLGLVPPPEGDLNEQDTDGDGILDSAQTLQALDDLTTPGVADDGQPHPDGIPDLFQP